MKPAPSKPAKVAETTASSVHVTIVPTKEEVPKSGRMWCPKCGNVGGGKFCPECGERTVAAKGQDKTSDEDQDD